MRSRQILLLQNKKELLALFLCQTLYIPKFPHTTFIKKKKREDKRLCRRKANAAKRFLSNAKRVIR